MKKLLSAVAVSFLIMSSVLVGCGTQEAQDPINVNSVTQAAIGPSIDSPTPGSTLGGSSMALSWSENGAGAVDWWVYAGTFLNGANLHDSGNIEDQTTSSYLITGLPTNGSTIYVKLWYRTGSECCGPWSFVAATYTANSGAPTLPAFTSPVQGSTITSTSQSFTWTANTTTGINMWWIYAGPLLGMGWVYDSGAIDAATFSHLVTGLTQNGSDLWVRLWYRTGTSPSYVWSFVDHQYHRAGSPDPYPSLTSHAPNSTLTGTTETFTWAGNGWGNDGIDYWWLYVGTTQGSSGIYNSGWQGGAVGTSETVSGLPDNGGDIWLRIWFIDSSWGGWQFFDVNLTAFDATP